MKSGDYRQRQLAGAYHGAMELRTLRYFIAALEAGSLSRAAGTLYIAQPALTAQIKKLEDELGAQLFERSHAGVMPTPAGLQLYEDARRLLSDAEALRERIQRLPKGPEGSVTLALPFLLASLLSGPVLTRLKRTHPRIRVFVLDDLSLGVRQAMLDHRADVGVLVDTPAVDGLRCHPLARETIYLSGHDADGQVARLLRAPRKGSFQPRLERGRLFGEIPLEAALGLPLLVQSRRYAIRRRVDEAAAALGLALSIAHEHDSTRVLRSLFLAGAGFTFTPACSLPDAPVQGAGWVTARVVRPDLARTYTLATPAGKAPSAAAQVVIDALAHEARALIDGGAWDARWLGGRLGSAAAT